MFRKPRSTTPKVLLPLHLECAIGMSFCAGTKRDFVQFDINSRSSELRSVVCSLLIFSKQTADLPQPIFDEMAMVDESLKGEFFRIWLYGPAPFSKKESHRDEARAGVEKLRHLA